MIVLVGALYIELLEIEGILSVVDIVGAVHLGSAYDGLLYGIPRTVSRAALRRILKSCLNSGHAVMRISSGIEIVIVAGICAVLARYKVARALALLLQYGGCQHIRADS